MALAVDYCLEGTPESCYLRLVSIPCQIPYQLPAEYRLQEGRGVVLTEGDDAVLFGYGPVLLPQAFERGRPAEPSRASASAWSTCRG